MKCSTCPRSIGGSRDGSSDVCDDCQNEPVVGWGGFTPYIDNSRSRDEDDDE